MVLGEVQSFSLRTCSAPSRYVNFTASWVSWASQGVRACLGDPVVLHAALCGGRGMHPLKTCVGFQGVWSSQVVAMTALAFGNWSQHIFVNPEADFWFLRRGLEFTAWTLMTHCGLLYSIEWLVCLLGAPVLRF